MSTRTARLLARRAPVVVAKVRAVALGVRVGERLTYPPMTCLKVLCQVKQDSLPDLAKMVSRWP